MRSKGRRERITPLTNHSRTVLRAWLTERDGLPSDPVFPTAQGPSLSRDALERRLAKHLAIAGKACSTLAAKTVSMHTLRHTAAMRLLHAGVDSAVIALWLGHQSVDTTKIYLHADLELKQKAIARTTPPDSKPGRYRPPDNLLAFLQNL
jgi:integrase/recombinase XerD